MFSIAPSARPEIPSPFPASLPVPLTIVAAHPPRYCITGMKPFILLALLATLPWLLILGGCYRAVPEADPSADPFESARHRMVDQQLRAAGRGITNARVLAAMRTVPRHEFVPPDWRADAYADTPLPIGYDQTISQPYIVAFMTEQLDPQPADRVLEIGTGSGYQAAILSRLVAEVYSVELIQPLARRAQAKLHELGLTNVHVRCNDGYGGWPEHAPYDKIIVTCAPESVPKALVEQLKLGGRMIIPVGGSELQHLILLRKQGHQLRQESILPVRFVPMTSPSSS